METLRLPLKDLSNKQCNAERNGVGHGLKSHQNRPMLPSIKSLIRPAVLNISNRETRSAGNSPLTDAGMFSLNGRSAIGVRKSTDITTLTDNLVRRSKSVDLRQMPENSERLSKKLQIRLQFAYYKFSTNQSDVKFKDLKKKLSKQSSSQSCNLTSSTPANRRLRVSKGAFKTPTKRIRSLAGLKPIAITGMDQTSSATLVTSPVRRSQDSLDYDRLNETIDMESFSSDSKILTTPSTNMTYKKKEYGADFNNQNTPMSLKAAKSLISLFTGSRS